MVKRFSRNAGFTLIELLVVIAVIGILSSVVLASLNTARAKGKDTALIQAMKQFQNLLILEYNDTGSYANLQPNNIWMSTNAECDSRFSGTYAVKAREICRNIVANASSWFSGGKFYAGTSSGSSQSYSIMAALNRTNTMYCVGPSGTSSTDTGGWGALGCWYNP